MKCEIENFGKKLDIKKFIVHYINFFNHPSWTSQKHIDYKILRNYLSKLKKIEIRSHSRSNTTKVKYSNEFILFKVTENQRGYLKNYKNKWVIMYNSGKDRSTNFLEVYPIKKFNFKKTIILFKKVGLDKRFLDSDFFITFDSTYDTIKHFCKNGPLKVSYKYESYIIEKKLIPKNFSPSNKNLFYSTSRRLQNWLFSGKGRIPWSSLDITFNILNEELQFDISNKIVDSNKFPDYDSKKENFYLDINRLNDGKKVEIPWNEIELDDLRNRINSLVG
jgi:hypothetical protein